MLTAWRGSAFESTATDGASASSDGAGEGGASFECQASEKIRRHLTGKQPHWIAVLIPPVTGMSRFGSFFDPRTIEESEVENVELAILVEVGRV
jgi:hypothetical protein